ncbi:MAG: protein-disulfide reductase DsbD [Bdellovibrionales bacterium]|nr:protein-disulfide reductase DsbD [Bdellovibrionales bacterium]
MTKLMGFLVIQSILLAWGHLGIARDIPLNPLTLESTRLSSSTLAPGANAELILKVQLLPGHHAYLEQFRLQAVPESALKIGNINVQPTVKFYDKFSKKTKMGIEKSATISAIIEIPENVLLGDTLYHLILTYQACTDSYCHLPKTIDFKLPVNIVSIDDSDKLNVSQSNLVKFEDSQFSQAKKKGWIYLILFVFLAGLLTGFTPCIFPMIPITLTILHGHKKHLTHWQGFWRSCIYVLGIAITYVALGLFAASTGSLFGSFLGHPIMAMFLASIFFLMALSMFGAFEIKLPHFIEQKLLKHKTEASYKGIFVAGLLAGIVASPCVGPVLISVLTFVAKSQNVVLGGVLLFFFALGFGVLFIVLGTFGEIIKKLPKAGHWMIEIKELFGWAMLALALYYLKPVMSDHHWHMLLAVVLISTASLSGAFTSNENLTQWQKLKKGWMLAILIVGTLILTTSFFPKLANVSSLQNNPSSSIPWQRYSEELIAEAKSANKGVIIDFYASWCAACKDLVAETFSSPEVQALKDKFIWIKFDATNSSDLFDKLRKKYSILGLPHIVFYAPTGKWLPEETLTGFENAKEFTARMLRVLVL